MKRKATDAVTITVLPAVLPPTTVEYLNILRIEHVKSMDFEMLVAHLRRDTTLQTARPCIAEVVGACNARVFLAAYMIAFKPNNVFEVMDDLARALFDASGPMLSVFEEILTKSREKDPAFEAMTTEYFLRFSAWKKPDSEKLVTRIKHALVALYTAEHHLPETEAPDSLIKVMHAFGISLFPC